MDQYDDGITQLKKKKARRPAPPPAPGQIDAFATASDGNAALFGHRPWDHTAPAPPLSEVDAGRVENDESFAAPVLAMPTRELRGMVRETDGIESQRAAVDVSGRCAKIRERIMQIIAALGPRNARELEEMDEFRDDGPSTVRKRITELKQAGDLVQVGRRDKMAVWDIALKIP